MAVDATVFANLTPAQRTILETYHTFGDLLFQGQRPPIELTQTHKQATKVLSSLAEIIQYLKIAESAARYIVDFREQEALTVIRTDSNS